MNTNFLSFRQLILSREKNSKSQKSDSKNSFASDEPSEDVAQESIMMVDSSFFSSGTTAKPPLGPTIMNAEPDGFICPVPQSSATATTPNQRKRKSFARFVFKGYFDGSINLISIILEEIVPV